mmetsp:Transcript_71535/g.168546  ORF Transcript_71535/g.168546 Transcript_71535/m.168546 type:complete len:107 (+) Transcript_71535:37-357(+)
MATPPPLGIRGVGHMFKYFTSLFKSREGIRFYLMKRDVKEGVLIGEDENGNKYYENVKTQCDRSRWVEYADPKNYDPTMVPAEWHGWLHRSTDLPGHQVQHKASLN